MARPTLFHHRKFRRLARLVGSRALAVGSLELLWAVANDAGDPLIGPPEDVEDVADWRGEPGTLAAALVTCGFLDETPDGLVVHDHQHHCPTYVQRRHEREKARRRKGLTLSDVRRQAAETRWSDAPDMQTDANDIHLHTHGMQTAPLPSPITHHPSPHTHTRAREGSAPLTAGLKAHRTHAVCGRVCLHASQFEELTRLSGKPEAEADAYVRQWALGVLAAWPEGDAIGDDAWAFWRLRWGEAHPSTRKAARQVQDDAVGQRWLAKGAQP